VVQADISNSLTRGAIAGAVAGMMAVYGYYLGYRRHVENQLRQIVPPSLLRCPFVVGILSKQPSIGRDGPPPEAMSTVSPPTAIAGKHS